MTIDPTDDAVLQLAAQMVATFEGVRLTPYQDSAGIWTIGYGTIRIDGVRVTADTPPITLEHARELLEDELSGCLDAVRYVVTAPATVGQLVALCSLAYNCGTTAMSTSSAVRLLNLGHTEEAADALLLWDKVRDPRSGQLVRSEGLLTRRTVERAIFLEDPP